VIIRHYSLHSFFLSITMTIMAPSSPPYPTLTQDSIHEAIDHLCECLNHQASQWKLCRATKSHFQHAAEVSQSEAGGDRAITVDETLLYGVFATHVGDGSASELSPSSCLATFFFSYSTWDGRVLYLDRFVGPSASSASGDVMVGLPLLLRRTLAGIALRLHCSRFTWQHYENKTPKYPGDAQPEYLDGWLTLHWEADTIQEFLRSSCQDATNNSERVAPRGSEITLGFADIQDSIEKSLKRHFHPTFHLCLATADDVNDIGRLVQGLADFEKEPDAVNVSTAHYLQDGFAGHPLFYCIIIKHTDNEGDNKVYTCGMAFCFLGFTLSDGLFLYLEDLFIEPSYRGKGVGTLVMKALASIGNSLGCSRLVWQALVSA
jgi:GNAT superfamily N-acetyltransferase